MIPPVGTHPGAANTQCHLSRWGPLSTQNMCPLGSSAPEATLVQPWGGVPELISKPATTPSSSTPTPSTLLPLSPSSQSPPLSSSPLLAPPKKMQATQNGDKLEMASFLTALQTSRLTWCPTRPEAKCAKKNTKGKTGLI